MSRFIAAGLEMLRIVIGMCCDPPQSTLPEETFGS
jgi:hypothetical protein